MKLTTHFMSEEFGCKDGTEYPVGWIPSRLAPLCEALEVIRTKSGGRPIHIVSGYRTYSHNKRVGGASRSQHMRGTAVDMISRELSPRRLHNLILNLIKEERIPEGGVGSYKSFVHYDQRGYKARW
jgi:uncharacterized protein YcbK (DUF882 family)